MDCNSVVIFLEINMAGKNHSILEEKAMIKGIS
jgi:hypothetical protein